MRTDNFRLMVTASDKFEEFSKRLRKALRDAEVEVSSPTQLAREIARRTGHKVTPQAVRKWLNGEAIPKLDKIEALALWLRVGAGWLYYAKGTGTLLASQTAIPPYGPVPSDQELLARFHRLSRLHQSAVSEIMTALATNRRRLA